MLLKRGKPFTDGTFIKDCLQAAASIPVAVSPNTMADRADDIARDLASQLRHKCATFSHSTLALDKSTDSSDMAKLTIFERGTDEDMGVLEELLDLGKGHVISDMMQAVQGFEMRLSLFEEQLRKGELFHFESLKPLSTPFTQVDQNKYVNTAKKMRIEFADNSQDVRKMQTGISLIIVPFPMPLREVPLPLQNEVIDLRCDKVLEVRFQSVKLLEFCTFLSIERFPKLKCLYRKNVGPVPFDIFVKTRFRSRLTDKHLIGQLRVMARSSLQPDFNNLILEKNAQVSPTD
ncbi:hypothetical protein FOCC_FOCC016566 [Frankliniella occidentalis]|nr:hypothetical protein FOCC_FOCC016566 [Frankliniella occidentalis]